MPAKSKAQLRWVNSKQGHEALGEKGVKEWNEESKNLRLPERLGEDPKKAPVRKLKRGMQGKTK